MAALDNLSPRLETEKLQHNSIHRQIQVLKDKISDLSRTNYELEKEVRFFDQRIGLLINHKKGIEELTDYFVEGERSSKCEKIDSETQQQKYGNLFFLLQTEASYLAQLTRIVSLDEIDDLLQPVLFSLYGNQYELREEYLLLTMFQLALKYEVNESETFNSLLRANTAITRMMTTYTRRGPGQEYLKSTLGALVRHVVDQDHLQLEINPLKVYVEIYGSPVNLSFGQLTMERALDDPRVQEVIQERSRSLKTVASQFVSAITGSLHTVPYGIRWLCSTIVYLVKEKYPNVSDTNIASLIGGFFLLRFLNPAIVTPNAYMLVNKPASQCARRNLTLIAKLLQSMANPHAVKNHFKEEYMQPLQSFATEHVDDVQDFLMKLFKFNEITDFYETLEIEQYLSLSKDIKIRITPNEMYRIHELILKHKEELALTEDDPLHIILDELGPPGKQLSYSMNATICLTLTNRWDHSKVLRSESFEMLVPIKPPIEERSTKEELKTLSVKLFSLDVKFMEERSLVSALKLAKSSIAPSEGETSESRFRREQAAKLADCILQTYKQYREESDKLIKDPDFLQEVKQEVQHKVLRYFRLKPKVNSLREVYGTLLQQESYLKDQLSVYKEYLAAVRAKAVTGSSKREVNYGYASESGNAPVSFSYSQLEKEGVAVEGQKFPDKRKSELIVRITSSQPGVYQVCLHNTGDSSASCEVHLNLEELLELQHRREQVFRLSEFVSLDVRRFVSLLHKNFTST